MSKRTLLKAVCCVLSLMMLIGAMPLTAVFSAAAKDEIQSGYVNAVDVREDFDPYDIPVDYDVSCYPLVEGYKTIVFSAPADWELAIIYCWKADTIDYYEPWPGVQMKPVAEDNGYVAYIPEYYDMVVISDGDSKETIDIEVQESTGLYIDDVDDNGKYTTGYWLPDFYEYLFPEEPTTPDETAPVIDSDTITLYYENSEGWDKVYCHAWNYEGVTTSWPGESMKHIGNNIYKVEISNEFTSVVFSNGTTDSGCMSPDLYIHGDNMLYSNGEWSLYEEEPTVVPPSDSDYIYFYNSGNWSTVYAYCYGGDGELFGTWPGTPGIDLGDGVWAFEMIGSPEAVIFNDYAGHQTCNLAYEGTDKIAWLTGELVQGDHQMVFEAYWYEELMVDLYSEIVSWDDGSYNYHAFKAEVAGGMAPYTYQFFLGDLDITSDINSNEASVCIGEYGEYYAEVIVTDSLGNSSNAIVVINFDEHQEETTSTEETTPVEETYTLYFRNHDDWYNVYAYSWNDGVDFSQPLGQWPGTACKYIDDDIWAIEVTSDFDYIIFNTSGKQSSILPNPGGFNIARWVSTDGNESEYEWEFPIITKPTEATEPSEVPVDDIKVYFDNSESYNQVFVYAWGEEDYGEISQWPGILATDENNGTWSVVIPGNCDCVLFHNGSGIQSNDLINPRKTMIAKVVRVEDGLDVYDWFDVEEITTTVTEPTEQITTEADTLPSTTDPTEEVTESMTVTDPEETETTVKPTETTATDAPETTATEATGTTDSEYALGDVDRDGKISIFDATAIQKYVAKIAGIIDEEYPYLADVNMDEKINIKDATVIQKYLALLIAIEDNREIVPEFAGATEDGVNIDGENYKVEVGDTVTYEFCIETPEKIENIQAYVAFDSSKLRLLDEDNSTRFGNMVGVVSNVVDGLVVFNASDISSGIDITGGKAVVSLKFEVLDSSATEIMTVIENMAEFFGSVYIKDGEQKNDEVKFYHTVDIDSKPTEPTTTEPTTTEPATTEATEEITTTIPTEPSTTVPVTTAPSEPEFETGDVNCDSKVNIKDVTAIQKFLAKLIDFTDEVKMLADYNGDGIINIKDATTIQKKLANLI